MLTSSVSINWFIVSDFRVVERSGSKEVIRNEINPSSPLTTHNVQLFALKGMVMKNFGFRL